MTKSEKYWQKRMLVSQKAAKKNVILPMKKLYREAYNSINKELQKVWMEMLEKGSISQSDLFMANRYRNLQQEIEKQLRVLANSEIKHTQESLMNTYIEQWNAVNEFAGISREWSIFSEQAAKQIILQNYKGATFSERVWNNTSALKSQLTTTITNTTILGQDVRKAAMELHKVLNRGYNSCKAITITETSRVFNESCRVSALESGLYKTYHVLLEPDACEKCIPNGGMHFDLNESVLPVHTYCKCTMIIDLPEKIIENNEKIVSNDVESGIMAVTGALDPNSKRASQHADRYYESIRHMSSDINKIANTTGWKRESIEKIKKHIFITEHDLGNGYPERFASSYDMAQSWQRLINGKPKELDLILLKHEYLELSLMKRGSSQYEAHIIASKKHNYAKAVKKGE